MSQQDNALQHSSNNNQKELMDTRLDRQKLDLQKSIRNQQNVISKEVNDQNLTLREACNFTPPNVTAIDVNHSDVTKQQFSFSQQYLIPTGLNIENHIV